jgi:hypothetical protein
MEGGDGSGSSEGDGGGHAGAGEGGQVRKQIRRCQEGRWPLRAGCVGFWEPEDKLDDGVFRPNWFRLGIQIESEACCSSLMLCMRQGAFISYMRPQLRDLVCMIEIRE